MKKFLILSLVCFLVFNTSIFAQMQAQPPITPEFDYDSESFFEMTKTDNLFVPSYGIMTSVFYIQSGSTGSLVSTIRPWIGVNTGANSSITARGKYKNNTFVAKEAGLTLSNSNLIDLDMLSYDYQSSAINFSVGRQFFYLGSGMLLNGRSDGVNVRFNLLNVNWEVFAAYSGLLLTDSNTFNISSRDFADGAERLFTGIKVGENFLRQQVNLFYLLEKDYASSTSTVGNEYSVNYLAFNISGDITSKLGYFYEAAYEFGKSYYTDSLVEADVRAFASIGKLTYFLDYKIKPKLYFDFAYGSGDSDRSSASSPTGNTRNKDGGFIAFGTFDGGIGLRPKLSNLIVLDAGASFIPFEDTQAGVKVLKYFKAKPEGIINSGEATLNKRDAGWGADLFVAYKVSSELSLTSAYGLFIPGAAFAADENSLRHVFMFGVNLQI